MWIVDSKRSLLCFTTQSQGHLGKSHSAKSNAHLPTLFLSCSQEDCWAQAADQQQTQGQEINIVLCPLTAVACLKESSDDNCKFSQTVILSLHIQYMLVYFFNECQSDAVARTHTLKFIFCSSGSLYVSTYHTDMLPTQKCHQPSVKHTVRHKKLKQYTTI